jgi:hypothetical protein
VPRGHLSQRTRHDPPRKQKASGAADRDQNRLVVGV